MNRVVLICALVLGFAIAYVDSRPTWNDTGVTVAVLLLTCGVLGAVAPSRPWLWALAVGGWIPAWEIASSRNYGSLLALPFAFAGAFAGMGIRRAISPSQNPKPA